jgi:hypothetical protein
LAGKDIELYSLISKIIYFFVFQNRLRRRMRQRLTIEWRRRPRRRMMTDGCAQER